MQSLWSAFALTWYIVNNGTGVFPYRYRGVDDTCNGNTKQRLEVLMITSQSGPGIRFPKVLKLNSFLKYSRFSFVCLYYFDYQLYFLNLVFLFWQLYVNLVSNGRWGEFEVSNRFQKSIKEGYRHHLQPNMSMYQLTHSYDGKTMGSQTYFKNCKYLICCKNGWCCCLLGWSLGLKGFLS